MQLAPSKIGIKEESLHSLALRSRFDTRLMRFFDKLQPIIAQFDLVIFAFWQKKEKKNV